MKKSRPQLHFHHPAPDDVVHKYSRPSLFPPKSKITRSPSPPLSTPAAYFSLSPFLPLAAASSSLSFPHRLLPHLVAMRLAARIYAKHPSIAATSSPTPSLTDTATGATSSGQAEATSCLLPSPTSCLLQPTPYPRPQLLHWQGSPSSRLRSPQPRPLLPSTPRRPLTSAPLLGLAWSLLPSHGS
jgi:hypothetical protein